MVAVGGGDCGGGMGGADGGDRRGKGADLSERGPLTMFVEKAAQKNT